MRLEPAGVDALGFMKLVVTDPVRGGYFQIDWPLSAAMLTWQRVETAEALIDEVYRNGSARLSPEDVAALAHFLQTNQLTELDEDSSWRRLATKARLRQHGILMTLLHGYLFFRIPLVRPQALLVRMMPACAFVYTTRFWIGIAAIALFGLYLSFSQWPDIQAAFIASLRLEGLAVYAVVLVALKAVHELGHGLTTVRQGCRVPTMGIAFMLGTPVLYTDTSDSWRLARRSERLAVVFAGVAAEMIVATIALLLWPFLSDGMMRQICFAIVTSAVVSTVVVNLNPFMRYDGYFALSDALQVPNLQARAFDLALWRLREWLFDLGRPPPEELPHRLRSTLIVYAALTALYRIGLYIGIAALVYHVGSKVLGIVLGLFEIVFFIAQPIWREVGQWWRDRTEILARRRFRLTVCVPIAALLVLCTPWLTTVEVPAVLQARLDEPVHLPAPAIIRDVLVKEGQPVRAGEILFVATSPDFEHQLEKSRAEALALDVRLGRLHASDKERTEHLPLLSRRRRAAEKIDAIERLKAELTIRAPADGRVVDIDPELTRGAWQGSKRPLARLVSATGIRARGVLSDSDTHRVSAGGMARFVPDDVSMPIQELRLISVAAASTGRLAEPMLAEKFGGTVPASDEKGELMLRQGWAEAHFEAQAPSPAQAVRGILRVDATPVSPLWLIAGQVARILVREHGF